MCFLTYKLLVITNPEGGALLEIAGKLGLPMIEHPAIGGRYSGLTSSTLVPCHLLGMNIDKLFHGAKEMYRKCSPVAGIEDNPALQIAASLYVAETKGYEEVFMPIYSKRMTGFSNLVIQLIHESSCKDGKGQTFYAASAPESQHHTNQRFFGGRRNVCGFFIKTKKDVQKKDMLIKVPDKLKDIVIRDGTLASIDSNTYAQVLDFEFEGVIEHAKRNKIPRINLVMEKADEFELGEFVGLWHYIAVYASILRDVNPFDQPEVEFAKKVSFELRKKSSKKSYPM